MTHCGLFWNRTVLFCYNCRWFKKKKKCLVPIRPSGTEAYTSTFGLLNNCLTHWLTHSFICPHTALKNWQRLSCRCSKIKFVKFLDRRAVVQNDQCQFRWILSNWHQYIPLLKRYLFKKKSLKILLLIIDIKCRCEISRFPTKLVKQLMWFSTKLYFVVTYLL